MVGRSEEKLAAEERLLIFMRLRLSGQDQAFRTTAVFRCKSSSSLSSSVPHSNRLLEEGLRCCRSGGVSRFLVCKDAEKIVSNREGCCEEVERCCSALFRRLCTMAALSEKSCDDDCFLSKNDSGTGCSCSIMVSLSSISISSASNSSLIF